jgi:hypothetical protein
MNDGLLGGLCGRRPRAPQWYQNYRRNYQPDQRDLKKQNPVLLAGQHARQVSAEHGADRADAVHNARCRASTALGTKVDRRRGLYLGVRPKNKNADNKKEAAHDPNVFDACQANHHYDRADKQ